MIVVVKKMKFFLARTTSEQKQVVGVCCYDVDFRHSLLIALTLSDVIPIDGGIGVFVDPGFGGHEGSGKAEMIFV